MKRFRAHTIACPKCKAPAKAPCYGKAGGNVHWERYAAATPESEEPAQVGLVTNQDVLLVSCPRCTAEVGVKCTCQARWRAARDRRRAELLEKAQRATHRLRMKGGGR